MEQWRDVVGYEGRYQVSNEGNVRSLDQRFVSATGTTLRIFRGRQLSLWCDPYDGYWRAQLGRGARKRVHQLVAAAFLGPRPAGKFALHRDDDKANNHLSNIYYGTHSDNQRDAVRNGKQRPGISLGEKHGQAKLKEADIPKILALAAEGKPLLRIAHYFGVTDMTIHDVVKGKTWGWLTGIRSP